MLSESGTSRILRSLPRDKAFYFFTSIGNYAGESAASLEEFVKRILDVNIKSLEFHLYRSDFEKWIDEALEDKALAGKVKQLKALKPIGIDLRDRLYLIVSKHYENLKTPRPKSTTFPKPKTTTITFGKNQSQSGVETQIKE
ncbi:MAG: hypothetical protein JSV51_04040 [Candidatus Bathyarchaeota archaeon]|nr:MAG: hypothetical protein JSV51_04040 [Candidatus Bathyarchaeota archaeon]